MTFLLKEIAEHLLSPMFITLIFLGAGIFLLGYTQREKIGKIIAIIGVVLFVFFSYDLFSNVILGHLENKYPPLNLKDAQPEVNWIVVLGGGGIANSRFPITSQLNRSSLCRLVEGLRIQRMLPESNLVLTGGNLHNNIPPAILMETLIKDLDIPVKNLMLIPTAKNTEDEALILKHMIGKEPFILVTSASHMYRAMRLCQHLGMNPIAAPTDHILIGNTKFSPKVFFPSGASIRKFEIIFHEYLGILWYRWFDRI